MDSRDKTITILLAKTEMEKNEFLRLDIEDINWMEYFITLELHPREATKQKQYF